MDVTIVSNEDTKNDCYNYRTDVYLSHIHNHNNNCEILEDTPKEDLFIMMKIIMTEK